MKAVGFEWKEKLFWELVRLVKEYKIYIDEADRTFANEFGNEYYGTIRDYFEDVGGR